MANAQLTQGAIKAIYASQPCANPVLQIVDVKKVAPNPGQQQTSNQDRYRLLVSDGENYQQGMLGTQQNSLIKEGKVVNNTVVRLQDYVCNNTANNRRIIIILNLDVVAQSQSLIGNPVNIENSMQGQALPPVAQYNSQSNNNNNSNTYNNNSNSSNNNNNNSQSFNNSSQNIPTKSAQIVYNKPLGSAKAGEPISKDKASAEDLTRNTITPVNSLNPYQNRWTIKARVTFKGEIKRYSNDRTKDGKLFHFDVVDREKGEIRITMFNEIVDVFYTHIHQGNVYYISRGSLKFANKKFTSIKHEYELTLDRQSVVQQAADDGSIGGIDFQFFPISRMQSKNRDELVDVLGVVLKADNKTTIKVQKQERDITKRTLTLIDIEGACIDITLWGQHAENVNDELINSNPIVAVKGAKVSDYNTRTLNCSGAAILEWNPNLEEAQQLRTWFDNNGGPNIQPAVELSVSTRTGSTFTGASKQNAQQRTFAQAKANPPSDLQSQELFVTRGTLIRIPHDNNVSYKACINANCNRRVTQMAGGDGYTCPKCETISHCDERYILSATVADHTGYAYLSAFNEAALIMLDGLPANKLPNKQENLAAYDAVFTEAAFKMYRFTIRAKMENYNSENRLKNTIVSVEKLDFVEESKRLLQEISQY